MVLCGTIFDFDVHVHVRHGYKFFLAFFELCTHHYSVSSSIFTMYILGMISRGFFIWEIATSILSWGIYI